jgi:hypothetical protein
MDCGDRKGEGRDTCLSLPQRIAPASFSGGRDSH